MSPTPTRHRVLITGGAGFIGSHLTEWLLARGCTVTVVDNLSTGRLSNLEAVGSSPQLTFIQESVEEALPNLDPESFDEIYHLAAAVGVRLVIDQPVHTIRTNVFDTLIVLDFAVKSNATVLLASTSEVYGKSEKTPFAEDDDVTYGPTIYNRWSYACSKAIDEYLGLAYHRQQGLPVVVTRFFNTIGPRQIGRYGMVVPRFVERALSNSTIDVHGDGLQTRCFCDVRDIVPVLPQLLENASCHGRVFNIGNDEPVGIKGLAELVCSTLESSSEIQLVPYAEALGENFDDLRHRQPNLSRLRAVMDFSPKIPLHQTIHDLASEMSADSYSVESTSS